MTFDLCEIRMLYLKNVYQNILYNPSKFWENKLNWSQIFGLFVIYTTFHTTVYYWEGQMTRLKQRKHSFLSCVLIATAI